MSARDDDRPEPVDGTTFDTSARKMLLVVLGGLFFVLLAAVVVVWQFAATGDDRPGLYLTLGAITLGILGVFFIGLAAFQLLRKRRVVIGDDRVQIVQESGGEDVVMFANVAGLIMLKHEGGRDVRVRLADRGAEGTYDAMKAIRPRPSGKGFEFAIFDEYQGTIDDLLKVLDKAVRAWRREGKE